MFQKHHPNVPMRTINVKVFYNKRVLTKLIAKFELTEI